MNIPDFSKLEESVRERDDSRFRPTGSVSEMASRRSGPKGSPLADALMFLVVVLVTAVTIGGGQYIACKSVSMNTSQMWQFILVSAGVSLLSCLAWAAFGAIAGTFATSTRRSGSSSQGGNKGLETSDAVLVLALFGYTKASLMFPLFTHTIVFPDNSVFLATFIGAMVSGCAVFGIVTYRTRLRNKQSH